MRYSVLYTESALKQLKKLDRVARTIILSWIEKKLIDCEDPRLYCKALVADLKGYWRYRIGKYRVLAQIKDSELLILVVTVGHRKEVYDS